jgi:Fe-S-cluster containining protein
VEEEGGMCKGCATCCKTIRLTGSMKQMKTILKQNPQMRNNYGLTFAIKYFKPISAATALRANPHLKDMLLAHELIGYFYSCRMLNSKTNQCMAYDKRPPVCKLYPANQGKAETWWYTPECGYREVVNA